jgi:hypothetical protein
MSKQDTTGRSLVKSTKKSKLTAGRWGLIQGVSILAQGDKRYCLPVRRGSYEDCNK